jgi:cell division protein FtsB
MTASPVDNTTDLHADIATLRAERDTALSEKAALAEALAMRNSEYGERIEHQAATIDVRKAMSASPDDPQPVFDLIVERARDLCDAHSAGVYGFDGTLVQLRAATGVENDPERLKAFTALYPRPPTRDFHPGRAILDRKIVRIDDVETDPGLNPLYRGFTNQSGVAVPLLLDGVAIGALGLGRRERGGFSDSQVALLQIFAEQAVIAIGSTETYRELQERTAALATRNSEYGERIEQQSATIDVLKVMSASPGDPQPVFDLIATRARDLCDAYGVAVFEFDGTLIHWRAATGVSDDPTVRGAAQAMFPMAPTREWGVGRAILECRVIRIDDLETEPGLSPALRAGTAKSSITIPLMPPAPRPVGVALRSIAHVPERLTFPCANIAGERTSMATSDPKRRRFRGIRSEAT